MIIIFLGGQFSNIGFKASNEGIRTYTGKWELRSNTRCLRKRRPILVTPSLSTHMHIIVNSHTSYNTIITAATATDLIIGTVDGWLDWGSFWSARKFCKGCLQEWIGKDIYSIWDGYFSFSEWGFTACHTFSTTSITGYYCQGTS